MICPKCKTNNKRGSDIINLSISVRSDSSTGYEEYKCYNCSNIWKNLRNDKKSEPTFDIETQRIGGFKYVEGKWISPINWIGVSDTMAEYLDGIRNKAVSDGSTNES